MKNPLSAQTNKSKKMFLILLTILILCGIGYIVKTKIIGDGLIRECPSEMIVNDMPGADRSGESDNSTDLGTSTPRSYYILNDKRKEVIEFDTAWISENCQVPVTNAQ